MVATTTVVCMSLQNLEELIPGDDPIVVEINPPEGELYPVQLVRVDGGLFAAAEETLSGLEINFYYRGADCGLRGLQNFPLPPPSPGSFETIQVWCDN